MGLMESVGEGPVALDSSVFVYWIEEHPRFAPVVRPLFEAVSSGRLPAVSSAITLLEVLVHPFRAQAHVLVERYEEIMTRSPGLTLHPIDIPLLRAAAAVRASTRARTPDALQLATALAHKCTAFVTNDHRLPKVPGLPIVQLEAVA